MMEECQHEAENHVRSYLILDYRFDKLDPVSCCKETPNVFTFDI